MYWLVGLGPDVDVDVVTGPCVAAGIDRYRDGGCDRGSERRPGRSITGPLSMPRDFGDCCGD